MFCSTIIPTIGRPTLSRAVKSVLEQSVNADFEVIVVNDSGQPLPDMDWQHSERVQVVDTARRERSVARNAGSALARGEYLHFLDDDDVILPGALAALWRLSQTARAGWLYGAYQTVDNEGNLIEEIRPGICGNIFALLIAGESIPLQASLLSARTFHGTGCFDPNPALTGVEDRDLGRRVALASTAAYTDVVVASIRIGEQGSTTTWATLAEADRLGREKALSAQGAFSRLSQSATSCYWQGRVSRAFLASTAWNLRRRRLRTASSRAVAGLKFARARVFARDFWRGLGREG